jgi:Flp pilus assembly protein TadG
MTRYLAKFRRALLGNALAKDERGISVVEFALIGPMFISVLMATFDLGFGVYTKSVLQGAVEDAARQASLENTQWTTIKNRVNQQILAVIPAANAATDITFNLDSQYYEDYDDVIVPEDFTDTNTNGQWDSNECFVDRNNNRTYDTNVGIAGRGGAQDVVSIKASVTYVRIFPLWSLVGQANTQTIEAATYLRNQPFSAQTARTGIRICP